MYHGKWPEHQVDHINGIRSDNRPGNLREATFAQNQQNRATPRNNTSGCKCVSWCKKTGSWRVAIKSNGKSHWIGQFKAFEDAKKAYEDAAKNLHGDFMYNQAKSSGVQ
jgi:hypothetical protein